jgi:deoxyribodipyrimidine photo-lyase
MRLQLFGASSSRVRGCQRATLLPPLPALLVQCSTLATAGRLLLRLSARRAPPPLRSPCAPPLRAFAPPSPPPRALLPRLRCFAAAASPPEQPQPPASEPPPAKPARRARASPSSSASAAMSAAKRKTAPLADEGGASAGASAPKALRGGALVHPARVRVLAAGTGTGATDGPVLYWMSRDQRAADNWALLHAAELASASGAPLAVVFNLVPAFLGAGARQFGFMLRGLRETSATLASAGIPFFLLRADDPAAALPQLALRLRARALVTDFSPLRLGRQWRDAVAAATHCPMHEVDAHNIIPVWEASPKLEYAARTIRPKIHAKLPEYLTDFPPLPPVAPWPHDVNAVPGVDWDAVIAEATAAGASVPEVAWAAPGEAAAHAALEGGAESEGGGASGGFLPKRLKLYEKRNDPNTPAALSGLSPWLHFGQLAPQRAALAAKAHAKAHSKAVEGFLEELIVRRELADNFCFYNPRYDSLEVRNDHGRDAPEHLRAWERVWRGRYVLRSAVLTRVRVCARGRGCAIRGRVCGRRRALSCTRRTSASSSTRGARALPLQRVLCVGIAFLTHVCSASHRDNVAQRAAGGWQHARPAVERGAAGDGAHGQDARLHAHVRVRCAALRAHVHMCVCERSACGSSF